MNRHDATEFADMALQLHNEPDVDQTLNRVMEYAQQATGCDDAGIMLLHGGGRLETVATTHPRVDHSDWLQKELGEGPCVQAVWSGNSFLVQDALLEERWPTWGRTVAGLGLRSVLGVRLFTLHSTLGALDLYSAKPGFFDEDDLDIADIFARHASVALAAAREEHGLRQAIDARQLIGQAQGILMQRYGLDVDRAFAVLRRYARNHNIKLRLVAQDVVDTGRLPVDSQDPTSTL